MKATRSLGLPLACFALGGPLTLAASPPTKVVAYADAATVAEDVAHPASTKVTATDETVAVELQRGHTETDKNAVVEGNVVAVTLTQVFLAAKASCPSTPVGTCTSRADVGHDPANEFTSQCTGG